jgi:hypothetical protein
MIELKIYWLLSSTLKWALKQVHPYPLFELQVTFITLDVFIVFQSSPMNMKNGTIKRWETIWMQPPWPIVDESRGVILECSLQTLNDCLRTWSLHYKMVILHSKYSLYSDLSMKDSSLFCFVVMRSTKPECFRLCSWCLWKAFDEEGCMGLVPWRLDLRCKSSWILNDFFTEN